jgi:anti-anti-sigma regulatory factor
MNFFALDDGGPDLQILQPSVGARTQKSLIDFNLTHLRNRAGIARQIWQGYLRLDTVDVKFIDSLVIGILIGCVEKVRAFGP